MANTVFSQKRFQGISDYPKETANGQIADSYYFGRAINYRDDPQAITLLPGSVKESGTVVTDLLKWADLVPVTLTSYFIGDSGNFYSRSSAGSWSNMHNVPNCHGNGLSYFSGDDYVYYTGDSTFGRYGPIQNSPEFYDDFLRSQGGTPQNTYSLSLLSASSQSADAADSASLDITGNLTLEVFFKATTLPTTGNSMTLVGKWDESTSDAAYKLDIYGVAAFFGNGVDGSLTISVDTTDAPIDSACSGVSGTQTLTATNASFAAGQMILIIQMQGTNAGQREIRSIQSYTTGTITLTTPLSGNYSGVAQVVVLKQYTNVTINATKTLTAKAWNGTTGGILGFFANGTFTVNGTISGVGKGFRGADRPSVGNTNSGKQGEGYSSSSYNSASRNANSSGGGGGVAQSIPGGAGAAGGGGGYRQAGYGGNNSGGAYGFGGGTVGGQDLTVSMFLGGGGGSGGNSYNSSVDGGRGGAGGNGGAIFVIAAPTIVINTGGSLNVSGAAGQQADLKHASGGGGGGAGGSIILYTQNGTLGTNLVDASGGAPGYNTNGYRQDGGYGGYGQIQIDYLTAYTGTAVALNYTFNPTTGWSSARGTTSILYATQDNNLSSQNGYAARLGISNNGTSIEYLTYVLPNLTTGVWNRLSVSWLAASSLATFYINGTRLGTATGTKTSIESNTALLYIGTDKGASALQNYFNGLLDDIRIWANVQTDEQIFSNNLVQINAASAGLKAYWQFNNSLDDATSNNNDLTGRNSPTFSIDVPFPAYSTRLDMDTESTGTGQTYTLLTAISEAGANTLEFTPINDPQASVGFYIDTKGTGDWTVTIHDEQNRVIATKTIANANLPSGGFIEFIFDQQWRKLIGSTYHMHLTVSTGTSKVVTSVASDFSTVEYATYFGILVTDTQFHPAIQFQYQPLGGVLTGAMIFGNERYLAVWDGTNYFPNFIAFPPAWRVRCFAFWREYLAIGMWRGGNIYDFDKGRIYFWDGIAPTFNFFIDVPEGQINALFGVDSDLYMFVGYRGNLLDYQGGYFYNTGNSKSNKLKRIPLLEPSDYVEIMPGAFTMWRQLLHFGINANSDSSTIQRGTYAFGTLNQFYPDTLSYDYVISTGNTGDTVKIGLVYPIGQSLIVGWQDGISYGADKVNFSNPPASSGEIQLLFQDDGKIWKEKANFKVRIDTLPLEDGESVSAKINIDRTGFTSSIPTSEEDSTFAQLPYSGGRGREYQIGADIFSSGTTSPTILGVSLVKDPLSEEEQF